ncbi:two-component sensor histidine kinase BarA [Shewanella sp. NIFS-20-20]|uniref:two-component sensor histidine kinase BarA n=1 Tax=Shewanella sp. NIFS-20-20 TaxID=2853806 RepID=UPI001C495122|nr:two-component sensor histidine kinase BarA [Shewanella sp. NIFS-20-20]MBV7316732.1 two-component sensor histidine kinase BarA [Shewanella sp. NIFS-20-20]
MTNSNNMTKYSLRSWVLVLALAPTILVGILLGSYLTINRFYELESSLLVQGRNVIEPLAIASELGLLTNNRESSKRLLAASQLGQSGLIKSIAIFDQQNQLFITSNYNKEFEVMRYREPLDNLLSTEHETLGDNLILRTPIFTSDSALTSINLPHTSMAVPAAANYLSGQHQLGYIAMVVNKEQALLEQHRAAVAAFIIVLIGVQLNLLFTFRLVKNVTQPITEMVRVVAKIREGKLDTRLQGNLIGELDLLKRGINAMASSLQEYHNEMQQNIDQATSDLRETLEQIEIQNVELDLAKKRALEASRIKSEFLTNMSHELRTPLNGVIGFARQLMKTPLQSGQQDYIRTIERSALNLLGIINDILDLSKLEAGKMVLETMPFSFRDMLNETVNLLAGSAKEKGLELIIDVAPDVPDNINGDGLRVGQIITNLVGNAIKFTDKGHVILKVRQTSQNKEKVNLRCEVIDTGIGINKTQQEILFQAFGQADSSISRRFGGTGLGLIITKRLINQMGGQIGFSSEANSGSIFWFVLPLMRSALPANDPLPLDSFADKTLLLYEPRQLSADIILSHCRHWQIGVRRAANIEVLNRLISDANPLDVLLMSCRELDSERLMHIIQQAKLRNLQVLLMNDAQDPNLVNDDIVRQVHSVLSVPVHENLLLRLLAYPAHPSADTIAPPQPALETPINQQQLTVLAVDDNVANLKLIKSLLEELVTEVVTTNRGDKAIALAKENKFDLIFMDIQMPNIDGIKATKEIRSQSRNQHTPIIAVTAHAIAEERERIIGSGMDAYLSKPIDEAALKQIIMRWTAKPNILSQDNKVLDWNLCLIQANNKPQLAMEMLSMLLESLPETMAQIDMAHRAQDNAELISIVHKLHGASCYCGVANTQKLCSTIESALKHEMALCELEPEILELLDELTKVESAIKYILSQLSADSLDDQ